MSIKDFLSNTSLLLDVMVGFTNITFSELFNLKYGTIIEFNKLAGEPLDIFINDYFFGRGEAVELCDKSSVAIHILDIPSDDTDKSERIKDYNLNLYEKIPTIQEVQTVLESIADEINETNDKNIKEVANIKYDRNINKEVNEVLYKINTITENKKSRKIRIIDFKKELFFTKNEIEELKYYMNIIIPKLSKKFKNISFTLYSIKEEDYSFFSNQDIYKTFENYVMFDQRYFGEDYITLCASQFLSDILGEGSNNEQQFQSKISNPVIQEIEDFIKIVSDDENFSIIPLYVTNDYHYLQNNFYTKIEIIIKAKMLNENKSEGFFKLLIPSKLFHDSLFIKKKELLKKISCIYNIPIHIYGQLGRTHLKINEICKIHEGSIIELDKFVHEPINVIANGIMIAKGRLIERNEYFAVEVTEILYDNIS